MENLNFLNLNRTENVLFSKNVRKNVYLFHRQKYFINNSHYLFRKDDAKLLKFIYKILNVLGPWNISFMLSEEEMIE